MYCPHPETNRLRGYIPENLIDAARNAQRVTFAEVSEMRETIRALADLIVEQPPDLSPFFATGSIPYVIPLLHVLADRGERRMTDGTRFHLFPGLSWGGRIDGRKSLDFFVAEFAPLLTAALERGEVVRVLSIDTTNTGNAVNRIVTAFEAALDGVPAATPDNLEITVIGIVNGGRAGEEGDEAKLEVTGAPEPTFVLIPKGYSPDGPLVNRTPVRFRKQRKGARFTLKIAYWAARNIPSEDVVELIGTKSLRRSLGVEPDETAGRIVIEFENGMATQSTGFNTTGHRFLSLLWAKDSSFQWRKLCEANAVPPLTEEDRAAYDEGKFWTDGGLRLFELNNSDAGTAIQSLLAQDELESVEIYWLSQQSPLPVEALELVASSARKDPESRGPEAVVFFRLARKDLAAEEPEGDDPLSWWLSRLSPGGEASGATA